MGVRTFTWGRALLVAGLAVALFGCVYGHPGYYGYGNDGYYDDYYGYNDRYYDDRPVFDPLGPVIGGLEHLLIGPIVGSILGGTMGYGYEPYYHDRYYDDDYYDRHDRRYDDRYYDDYYYDPYYPR